MSPPACLSRVEGTREHIYCRGKKKKLKKKKTPAPIRINLSNCKYEVCEYTLAAGGRTWLRHASMGAWRRWPEIASHARPCTVRIVTAKLGWKEVGDDEDWEIYWTDTSISIERVIRLTKIQVKRWELVTNQTAGNHN